MSTIPPSVVPPPWKPDAPVASNAPTQTEPYVSIPVSEHEALKNGSSSKPSAFMTTVFTHWKSTANGLLAGVATVGLALLATNTTTPVFSPKVILWITFISAAARIITGAMSKDAGALTSTDIAKQTAVSTAKQA